MNVICKLLFGAALIPASLSARETVDSITDSWEKELELNEVVVVAKRPVVKQHEGKLVYLVKNDPYAKGLDGVALLDRVPRVSVNNGAVSVAVRAMCAILSTAYLWNLTHRLCRCDCRTCVRKISRKSNCLPHLLQDMQPSQTLSISQLSPAMKLSAQKEAYMVR